MRFQVPALHRPPGRILSVIPDERWERTPGTYAHLPGRGQALWWDAFLCCTFVYEPGPVDREESHNG